MSAAGLLAGLETPLLLLDEARMQRNIARMQSRLDALGVAFRPHVKTSKCWPVVQAQLVPVTVLTSTDRGSGGFGSLTYSLVGSPNGSYGVISINSNGSYTVQLIATHPCYEDTSYAVINIYEVGLHALKENGDVEVYPNPSKGLISIKGNETLEFRVSVFNTEGKEVYANESVACNTFIDISTLPKGLYLLKLSKGPTSVLKKLVLE